MSCVCIHEDIMTCIHMDKNRTGMFKVVLSPLITESKNVTLLVCVTGRAVRIDSFHYKWLCLILGENEPFLPSLE